ncbi:MAG: type I restriction-modification enzyme R subunit C-terminal domain-containing protein [Devosia sp.]
MRRLIDAPNSDLFDVLAYIRFTSSPKTREQRAGIVEQTGLAGVDREMHAFLVGILQAYTAHGEDELSLTKLAAFLTARYGSITDAKKRLGEPAVVRAAFINLQQQLYRG